MTPPETKSATTAINLDLLRTNGPDALAPDPTDPVRDVKVNRIDLAWKNALHEASTIAADDVLRPDAPIASHDNPLPKGAQIARATLAVELADAPVPHAVEITPPDTVICQYPADAPVIASYLAKHHFLLTQKAAQLLAILLALAGAFIPDLDDDDDDEEDTDRPLLKL